ncbi:MAG: hypothetical protein ACRCZ2_03355, partial [Fusobacteriaceae bacterium]
MKIYIYKLEQEPKLIARPQAESFSEFQSNPKSFYPDWTDDLIASEIEFRYPKLVEGILAEKTQEELKVEGILKLSEGDIVFDGKVVNIEKPDGVKVVWDIDGWVETATIEEIEEHNFKKALNFYNEELEFAGKAATEFACEIIAKSTFDEVKEYMKAID